MEVGNFGHLAVKDGKEHALVLQEGFKTNLFELRIDLSAMLVAPDAGFADVLEDLRQC